MPAVATRPLPLERTPVPPRRAAPGRRTVRPRGRWILVCFLGPVLAGLVLALFVPAAYTARSLLIIGESGGDGPVQTMLPEVAGMQLLRAGASSSDLRDLLSRSGPPRVIQVGMQRATANGAVAELGGLLNTYAATAADAALRVARTAADMAHTEQLLDGLRQQAGVVSWDEDSRAASRRVGELARQLDDAEQQATVAAAGAKAARQLLAGQPGNVLEFRETATPPPSDPAHALLLGLLLEREHLIAQYAPDFPAVREVNSKIEAIRSAIAADARAPRGTVREVRNPVADQLKNQASAAFVTAAEAGARLDTIQHQLAGARTRTAQIAASQPRLRELQRLRGALEQAEQQQRTALEGMQPLSVLGAPVIEAVDRSASLLAALAGLLLGGVSAAAAWLIRPSVSHARSPMRIAARRLAGEWAGEALPVATPARAYDPIPLAHLPPPAYALVPSPPSIRVVSPPARPEGAPIRITYVQAPGMPLR